MLKSGRSGINIELVLLTSSGTVKKTSLKLTYEKNMVTQIVISTVDFNKNKVKIYRMIRTEIIDKLTSDSTISKSPPFYIPPERSAQRN